MFYGPRTNPDQSALIIGRSYIDVTMLVDRVPAGDEKEIARDYAVSFGGNAVTAAFVCAHLGLVPELLTTMADDYLGEMFRAMAKRYGIRLYERMVSRFALSTILPSNSRRPIIRARDEEFLHGFPSIPVEGRPGLHLDGHQPLAALHYAKACREHGVLTSLDGGSVRENTDELLHYIDVAVVSERFCEQLGKQPGDTLAYLRSKGCKVGGVTMGEYGMLWYPENGGECHMPALHLPAHLVIDTNGAGDAFHGGYFFSKLTQPEKAWEYHFKFARAVSAHWVQHLGNEASLPTEAQVQLAADTFEESALKRVLRVAN